MMVLTLSNCPSALRGSLSAWLQEIDTNVFVGTVSARVRDALWERVCEHIKTGRATLVYPAQGEQRLAFRVHNTAWQPLDYDGLQLMLRPGLKRADGDDAPKAGQSKAQNYQRARAMQKRQLANSQTNKFLVLDLETTGLNAAADRIIEIGALAVEGKEVKQRFQALIRIDRPLPEAVRALTGITDELLNNEGRPLPEALREFLAFAGSLPVVSHNAGFDYGFLRAACQAHGLPVFTNPVTDTHALARRLVDAVDNYQLATLAAHFDIRTEKNHRSIPDCFTTLALYGELMKISRGAE